MDTKEPVIKPSIGRVVLFRPGAHFKNGVWAEDQPAPALICRVWSPTMINVSAFDANGAQWAFTSVQLCHNDDEVAQAKAQGVPYAYWMPYQKGQAAKAEQLEAALAAKSDDDDGAIAT